MVRVLPAGADLARAESQAEVWESLAGAAAVRLPKPLRGRDGRAVHRAGPLAWTRWERVAGQRTSLAPERVPAGERPRDLSRSTAAQEAAWVGGAAAAVEGAFLAAPDGPGLAALRSRADAPFDGGPAVADPADLLARINAQGTAAASLTRSERDRIAVDCERARDGLADGGPVLVHGDLHLGNLLADAGRPVVVDPETTHAGPAGFDGAYLLWHLALARLPAGLLVRAAEAYLAGGGRCRPEGGRARSLLSWCWLQELWIHARLGRRFGPGDLDRWQGGAEDARRALETAAGQEP